MLRPVAIDSGYHRTLPTSGRLPLRTAAEVSAPYLAARTLYLAPY